MHWWWINVIVAKFGSSSLQTIEQIKKIKSQILDSDHQMVVVSAFGGDKFGKKLTDVLIGIYQETIIVKKMALITPFLAYHQDIISALKCQKDYSQLFKEATNRMLNGDYDTCLATGEYLSATILSEYFEMTFVDSRQLIFFSKDQTVDIKRSSAAILDASKQHRRCLVPGFYGDYKGNIHLFTRGGSDITAAVIAYAIDATLYENWKDTDGIYNDDIKTHKVYYDFLSYESYYKLVSLGNRVIHKEAVDFAQLKEIPIRVCSVDTGGRGTVIGNVSQREKYLKRRFSCAG